MDDKAQEARILKADAAIKTLPLPQDEMTRG
jgi:hypothetical protein